jgi:hypothetical protein
VSSNLKSHINILKQEGTSRYERNLPALNPENVSIDDRKLQDFIAYAQRYSKNLLFINTESDEIDLKADTWEFFFKQDIVLLIANIATKNVHEIKTTYDFLAGQFQKERSITNFDEWVEFVFSRFQKINSWYYSSTESELKRDLTLYIGSYLTKGLEDLRAIKLYMRNLQRADYTFDDFKIDLFNNTNIPVLSDLIRKYNNHRNKITSKGNNFERDDKDHFLVQDELVYQISNLIETDNIWEIKEKQDIAFRENIFAGKDEEEKLLNASLRLNNIFEAVYHATEAISNSCNNYFDDTINKKQDHSPHVALLIAFIKLYGYAQQELNKIPEKHLDYYYKEVLDIKKKNAIPDQVFIVFDLAKGFEAGEIKKGTALSAGKDSRNAERVYEVDEDIVINKATIASLNTIFIDKYKDQIINYYTESLANKGVETSDASVSTSWKVFGEPKKENIAEIGLGIASTQFYLTRGERNVIITFESHNDIQETKFDHSLIKLLLTGEKGWLSSDNPGSRVIIKSLEKTSEKKIELTFAVSIAQEAAVVAFNKKIHPGNFHTSLPVLQCILKYPDPERDDDGQPTDEWKNKIAQLNILQKLQIVKTNILVQVGSLKSQISFDGVKDLILANHEAPLDSKKPFFPFTPMPKVGSSFYIGCKDLFYKDIKNLSINIEWMLPEKFGNYYQNYLPPYDSNKFEATLSILKNNVWVKIKDVSVIDISTKDPKYRSIKLDFDKLKGESDAAETGLSSFDETLKNKTIRLKLNYPDFGHTVYPQLITSAMMEKANSKSSVNFYQVVKHELHDSRISIKLPEGLNDRAGSLKTVIYDVLERVADDAQARIIMVKGLSQKIKERNSRDSDIAFKEGKISQFEDSGAEEGERVEVNDKNVINNVLGILKKFKLISKDTFYDRDKQNAGDVVNEVKEKVNPLADFIMPSDRELTRIIANETDSAINKTVANIVDQLLELKKSNKDIIPEKVSELIKKEFEEANDVINDMIARKIALLLSADKIPLAPYSPLINNISLSYSSVKSSDQGEDQYFYITPFGISEIDLSAIERKLEVADSDEEKINYIFPTSIVGNGKSKTGMEGMLFIGIKDIEVNHNLSLLIQLTEGMKCKDKKPPDIVWWYLKNNEWIRLKEGSLISDSTYGFQTTGIIKLSIDDVEINKNTLFGFESLFWLCASVVNDSDTFPLLIDVKTQAAVATFKDHGNDPNLLSLPLEAEKIKGLVEKVPFVKKVSQPVSSFNGKSEEYEQDFYTRIGERLRHKARAVNNWDYERLVLENFQFLYKVKCLNNYYSGHFATGNVTIVPIPDLRNKNYKGNNVLMPRTSYMDLRKIEKYLSERSSPFIRIHALNPQLDQVLINCKVRFHSRVDKGFLLKKLNEDLIRFLTPWSTGDMDSLSFTSKIYASSIINFINKREYVDYVEDFVMKQYTENADGEKTFIPLPEEASTLEETVFTTPHSILVSAPEHGIGLM